MACERFVGSPIFVYIDRPLSEFERVNVEAARAVAQALLGQAAKHYFIETNRGLFPSVIAGVSDILTRFSRVIVVEDDLELASDFMTYMN
jgi:ABC-type amino acid transport substrate-binding protein